MKVTEESEKIATAEKSIITGGKTKMNDLVRHKKAVGKEKTDE